MDKKNSLFSKAQKIITFTFSIIFIIILITLLCFDWIPYCVSKTRIFPNIASFIISIVAGILVYHIFRKTKITNKTFCIVLITIFFTIFIAQIILLYNTYFYTGWDANVVNSLADNVAETGPYTTAGQSAYLTTYPNNVFIVSLLAFIKSIPFFGKKYLFLLAFNSLIVCVSGLLATLIIRKLISNKAALLSLFVTVPLILFSPWIMIPYSDTLSMIFPILTLFIYINTEKWWKNGLMIFFSIIGYYIKPTAILILIAIIFVDFCKKRWQIRNLNRHTFSKDFWLKTLGITNGICLALLLKYAGLNYINYQPNPETRPISFVHYLAMGQNSENCGGFLEQDYIEAKNGTIFELRKFCDRIINRTPGEQVSFFAKKLLMNYNDGAFAWGEEGSFYYDVPERNSSISNTLSNIVYNNGNKYIYLSQVQQIVWIFVLFGCFLTFKKNPSTENSILQLTLIELFIFVMIFEARARYLFCYAPLFVICASIGYSNLISKIRKKRNKITNYLVYPLIKK